MCSGAVLRKLLEGIFDNQQDKFISTLEMTIILKFLKVDRPVVAQQPNNSG
jgi:hypothetical protein